MQSSSLSQLFKILWKTFSQNTQLSKNCVYENHDTVCMKMTFQNAYFLINIYTTYEEKQSSSKYNLLGLNAPIY